MDEYYHFTKYEYIESIAKNGLITKTGDRSISVNDNRQVIYLSKGKTSTILMFFAMKWIYESYKGENGQELLISTITSIEYYDKMLRKEQSRNRRINFIRKNIEELKNNREAAIRVKNQVENMRKYTSFDEYWGKGVYLSINNISDVKYNYPDFHNCWVEKDINPENISIVILKNKETGTIIDDKNAIINYFMAMTSSSDLFTEYKRTIGIKDDKYTVHDTMKDFDKYYKEHEKEFNELSVNYELMLMPINKYISTYKTSDYKTH